MKLAIFSDIHFHNWSQFATIDEQGRNSRLQYTVKAASQILQVAQERACKAILFSGDLFHTKKIDAEVIDAAVMAFESSTIPIYGIAGNHDMANYNADIHSARALSGRIQWLGHTHGNEVKVGPFTIAGIPYSQDKEVLRRRLGALRHPDILLMHAGFAGMSMGSDYIADFNDALDPAKVDNIAGLVIAGHYHEPQTICTDSLVHRIVESAQTLSFIPDRTILVPGAPEQHNLGDAGQSRGFWILNTDAMKLEFIPLGSPKFIRADKYTSKRDLVSNYAVFSSSEQEDNRELEELGKLALSSRIDYTPAPAKISRDTGITAETSPTQAIKTYVAKVAGERYQHDRLVELGQRFLT